MRLNKLMIALFLAAAPAAMAGTTWYVNGVSGSDGNDCKSATSACKTIGHAISLTDSGDSIKVAAATDVPLRRRGGEMIRTNRGTFAAGAVGALVS